MQNAMVELLILIIIWNIQQESYRNGEKIQDMGVSRWRATPNA